MADAIPHAGPVIAPTPDAASDALPLLEADVPSPPPGAASTRGGMRGWVARLLRKPAEYARAYLTVSLNQQLHQQAVRTAEIGGRVGRLEGMDARLDELLTEVRSLALRLDDVERRQTVSAGGMERQAEQLAGLRTTADHHVAQADHQITLIERQTALETKIVDQVDEVIGVLGPRFDELDIKIRPLVTFDEDSFAVRVADGYLLLPRSEPLFTVAVANASSGGLEPGVRRVLQALLEPGMSAADVGANVGLLTLAMASEVGSEGRVRAFEPEDRVRAQLAKTLHLNGLAQVTLSAAAVGAATGRLVFHESPIIGHSSLYALPEAEQSGERAIEVEVVRLDDVVPPGESLDLVKIDVEGAELDVLHGMQRLLDENADIAVVAEFGPSHLARVGVTHAEWFDAFAAHGLRAHLIAEPSGAASPTDAEALTGVESANLVFVRPGGKAERRLPR